MRLCQPAYQGYLAIKLTYMGKLVEGQGYPYSRDRFNPLAIVFARSTNDNREAWWDLFPQKQIDTGFPSDMLRYKFQEGWTRKEFLELTE